MVKVERESRKQREREGEREKDGRVSRREGDIQTGRKAHESNGALYDGVAGTLGIGRPPSAWSIDGCKGRGS